MSEEKFHPQLLLDKSRLQEIYDLRVEAYRNSFKAKYFNNDIFNNGWKDALDELDKTFHWIIEDNNKIIATARLVILNNLKQTGEEFDKFALPVDSPFVYWSRLVVHPAYRSSHFSSILDRVRKNYILEHPEIAFAICWASQERHDALVGLGFSCLGDFKIKYCEKGESFFCKAYLFNPYYKY